MELILTKGRVAVVDDDFHRLATNKWTFTEQGYAVRTREGKREYLHRVVMDAKPGQIVDHINRDRLDCRRRNLRFVDATQNLLNAGPRKNNSGVRNIYRYVSRYKNQEYVGWSVEFKRYGKRIRKYFKNKADAIAERERLELSHRI